MAGIIPHALHAPSGEGQGDLGKQSEAKGEKVDGHAKPRMSNLRRMNTEGDAEGVFRWLSGYDPRAEIPPPKAIQHVLSFVLTWAIFERDAFDRRATSHQIEATLKAHLDKGKLSAAMFSDQIGFLRSRYKGKDRFQLSGELLSRKSCAAIQRREKIIPPEINSLERVISEKITDDLSVLNALFYVCFRVRNNLFHGEKRAGDLFDQRGLFMAVSTTLAIYLSKVGVPQYEEEEAAPDEGAAPPEMV